MLAEVIFFEESLRIPDDGSERIVYLVRYARYQPSYGSHFLGLDQLLLSLFALLHHLRFRYGYRDLVAESREEPYFFPAEFAFLNAEKPEYSYYFIFNEYRYA